MIFVTGGAGFIGSNFVRDWLKCESESLVNIDKLTYAGNLDNLRSISDDSRYIFVCADIGNRERMQELLDRHRPRAIMHLAAETHVDRSIHGPAEFIQTNVVGTFNLLEAIRAYWQGLDEPERQRFRFLHVSTDEVYGSLTLQASAFCESSPYQPNSPYSASKAASDHLVRAYHHTYGLPTITINCSNNYGPYQFPEKLIPLIIHNALAHKLLPLYGNGSNIRDWLYVADHCEAVRLVLSRGTPGQTYNVGGRSERTNLDVVKTICHHLDELRPSKELRYESLITFVRDRPGHDFRYAIDATKLERDLGWKPRETFESGLRRTVQWYLDNQAWVDNVTSGAYREWIATHYEPVPSAS